MQAVVEEKPVWKRPVSKGGSLGKIAGGRKYDNLRTLCDMCNTGKSDFYEPNGLN